MEQVGLANTRISTNPAQKSPRSLVTTTPSGLAGSIYRERVAGMTGRGSLHIPPGTCSDPVNARCRGAFGGDPLQMPSLLIESLIEFRSLTY